MAKSTKTTKTARKRRPGRVIRQAELLKTVYEVVSEVGIDAASMRQIATRAKVSTGTINYHFKNKEQLVMAALQTAYLMPLRGTEPTNSPLDRLKGFAFGYIMQTEPNDRFWRFWMNYTVYGSRNAELHRNQSHWFKKQHSFWAKLVREAISSGELPEELDAFETAEDLSIFVHGLMVRQILQTDQKNKARCRTLLERYFERLEHGQPIEEPAKRELRGEPLSGRRGKAAA
jgi:TetR/AcrR family transcriptional regulator, transcriptional repressor of bet genes